MISSFFIMVSLNTSGDEPRRDRLRECDRWDLGDGDRAERPSQLRTERGASESGTVSTRLDSLGLLDEDFAPVNAAAVDAT